MRLPSRSGDALAYVLLALAALFWAVNWVIGRGIRGEMPPVAMGFWRWMIALAILLPMAAREIRRNWRIVRRHSLILAALGGVGAQGYNTMVYVALRHTPATDAILFNSVSPVIIILLSWMVLGQRITLLQGLGVMLSFCGIAEISTRGHWSALGSIEGSIVNKPLIIAVMLWSLFTILLRWRPAGLSPLGLLCSMTLFGLPTLLPFYLWELYSEGGFAVTATNVGALAYFAVFPSILAYLFWNHGVAQIGPSKAGLFTHLVPAFGAVLAVIFLGERLMAYHVIGIAFIFGGIFLTTRTRRSA